MAGTTRWLLALSLRVQATNDKVNTKSQQQFLCIYISIYICIQKYIHLYACMYVCMHGRADGWMNGCMYGCVYVCVYIYTYLSETLHAPYWSLLWNLSLRLISAGCRRSWGTIYSMQARALVAMPVTRGTQLLPRGLLFIQIPMKLQGLAHPASDGDSLHPAN